MDSSVALVQAYLHVNGYFTVAEYPVLEAFAARTPGQSRTSTSSHSDSLVRAMMSFAAASPPRGSSVRAGSDSGLSRRPHGHDCRGYLKEHWDTLRHAQIRDPALGMLVLMEKLGVAAPGQWVPDNRQKERANGGMRMRRHS